MDWARKRYISVMMIEVDWVMIAPGDRKLSLTNTFTGYNIVISRR
jgi:hypothetical protein